MKYTLRLLFAVFLYTLTSCVSSKQVIYWQDAVASKPSSAKDSLADTVRPDITIQSFDVLDIKIKSSQQAFDDLLQSNVPGIYSYGSPGGANIQQGATVSSSASAGPQNAYYSGFFVDGMGEVSLPTLGKIRVRNLTIEEATQLLRKKAAEFIHDPYVEIRFLSFKVQVLGNVRNPGVINISNEKANLMEALAMANDLSDFANSKKIKVIRGDLKKNYKVYIVDLTSIKNTRESEAYYLQPNDIIYVEPLPRKYILANIQAIVSAVVIVNTSIILYRVFSTAK